jgi:hypothetical protein
MSMMNSRRFDYSITSSARSRIDARASVTAPRLGLRFAWGTRTPSVRLSFS